ncbi:hypothetical protein [Oceanobacillus indicireducens]|uniref:Uncharacterized protein n=1 Tax=Oceanobacillus indicireducens TaxID=1004261 RepID=A0A918D2M8_9BACI|nr:hypothetical protein [Oceanobacillus indicireducens]GGN59393.1 hypothetical protein GCM10007971_22440 [Oceanobacillus indicireducens]
MNKCFSVGCNNVATTEYCPDCLAVGGFTPKLLVIELQDETSVPKVFYKGKEIEYKKNVFFDWDTDTSIPGGLTYAIEHIELGDKYPTVNKIERRVKGHATD